MTGIEEAVRVQHAEIRAEVAQVLAGTIRDVCSRVDVLVGAATNAPYSAGKMRGEALQYARILVPLAEALRSLTP